jgi:hypothetical protein
VNNLEIQVRLREREREIERERESQVESLRERESGRSLVPLFGSLLFFRPLVY